MALVRLLMRAADVARMVAADGTIAREQIRLVDSTESRATIPLASLYVQLASTSMFGRVLPGANFYVDISTTS